MSTDDEEMGALVHRVTREVMARLKQPVSHEYALQLAREHGRADVIGILRDIRTRVFSESSVALAMDSAMEEIDARLYPANAQLRKAGEELRAFAQEYIIEGGQVYEREKAEPAVSGAPNVPRGKMPPHEEAQQSDPPPSQGQGTGQEG